MKKYKLVQNMGNGKYKLISTSKNRKKLALRRDIFKKMYKNRRYEKNKKEKRNYLERG